MPILGTFNDNTVEYNNHQGKTNQRKYNKQDSIMHRISLPSNICSPHHRSRQLAVKLSDAGIWTSGKGLFIRVVQSVMSKIEALDVNILAFRNNKIFLFVSIPRDLASDALIVYLSQFTIISAFPQLSILLPLLHKIELDYRTCFTRCVLSQFTSTHILNQKCANIN